MHGTLKEAGLGGRTLEEIDQHVGRRVRWRRMLIGMSQEKLGEKLNVSFQQIQKYEAGKNCIKAGRLEKIAEALSITVDYFFAGLDWVGEDEQLTPDDISFASTSDGMELNRHFARIANPAVRQDIVRLVQTLGGGDLQ